MLFETDRFARRGSLANFIDLGPLNRWTKRLIQRIFK
jgi:hypothetical protein